MGNSWRKLLRRTVSHAVVDDADQLQLAYRGFGLEPLREGRSHGPTMTQRVAGDRLAFTASELGFPTLTTATSPDDCVCVAYVPATPPGTRWCEFDIDPGAVMLWHPSAEHHAANQPGLEVMAARVGLERLDEVADPVGVGIPTVASGQVDLLAPGSAVADNIRRALWNFRAVAASDAVPGSVYEDDLVRAVAAALAIDPRRSQTRAVRAVDNRTVVRACLDYADSVSRIPAISELCLAAQVSERRLRQAFTAEFDTPPTRFFRAWALAEAHRRLAEPETAAPSVTTVALDIGFEHLGRFAGSYRKIYGESPSTTLRTAHAV